eukprot:s320_g31.t1
MPPCLRKNIFVLRQVRRLDSIARFASGHRQGRSCCQPCWPMFPCGMNWTELPWRCTAPCWSTASSPWPPLRHRF